MRNFKYWGIIVLFAGIVCSQSDETLFVNKVYFIGNEVIPDRQLLKNVNLNGSFLFSKTEFDRRILKLDAITIKNRYKSDGYLNTTVRDSFITESNFVDIYFIINEGKRSYINRIDIRGNNQISNRTILKLLGLKNNRPFNPVSLNTNLTVVEEKYHRIGKLFSIIDINTELRDSVNIEIIIDENQAVQHSLDHAQEGDLIILSNYDITGIHKRLVEHKEKLEKEAAKGVKRESRLY